MRKEISYLLILCFILCGCVSTDKRVQEYYDTSLRTIEDLKGTIEQLQSENQRLRESNKEFAEQTTRLSEDMGRTIQSLRDENNRITERNRHIGEELSKAIGDISVGFIEGEGELERAISGLDRAIGLLEELLRLSEQDNIPLDSN